MSRQQLVVGYSCSELNFQAARSDSGRFSVLVDFFGVIELFIVLRQLLGFHTTLPDFGTPPPPGGQYALLRLSPKVGDVVPLTAGDDHATDPVDPIRAALHLYFVDAALRFMFSHELAHVIAGHVFSLPRDNTQTRTRELYADDFGALRSFSAIESSPIDVPPDRRAYLWGFAIGFLFAVLESYAALANPFRSRTDATSSHPRGSLRSLWAVGSLQRVAMKDGTLTIVAREALAGRAAAVEAWHAAGWPGFDEPNEAEIREVVTLLAPGFEV